MVISIPLRKLAITSTYYSESILKIVLADKPHIAFSRVSCTINDAIMPKKIGYN